MLAFQTALKALRSNQPPPALRERETVPIISRVSDHKRLGPHEVHSTDISRIHCEDPQVPIVSIHLGQEAQTDINRDHMPSKQPEEVLRPPYRAPLPEHVSEEIGDHVPRLIRQAVPTVPTLPVVPAAPIPQHYISQELMDQRIREIIEAMTLDSKDDSHKLQGSLIAKELFDMNVLTGFHTPKIIKYKGIDSGQRVQQFRDSLGLYSNLNNILCRLFATSLQDEPLCWFHFLSEDSIHTFEQLQKIFIKAYAHNKDKEENLYSLISLKQAQGEKLEVFSKKFLELARKVNNLDQKTAMSTFTNALQFNCKAKEYLFLKKPKTLEDMIEKVNNYINLERMMPELNKPIKAVLNTKVSSTDSNNNHSSSDPGDPKRAKTEPERDNNQRSQKPSRTVIPKLNAKLSMDRPIVKLDNGNDININLDEDDMEMEGIDGPLSEARTGDESVGTLARKPGDSNVEDVVESAIEELGEELSLLDVGQFSHGVNDVEESPESASNGGNGPSGSGV
ncbi:hypothetical protein GIB67_014433 [Kingdonia uniflora]|uniref:Retrotransposon gag domain-containing protein n=2 Tax=Kingdonia uniflora TaxID=39325 RepID=A0A7J7LZ14_9MAGN|nr:hypothetical protein GIB67_014433 [Kingdonia uniflora]